MEMLLILQAAAQKGSPFMSIGMLLLIVVVFYFFMIRPQAKRQKEQQKFRSGLQKGDKIVTSGGIYGKVAEISDHTIIIECEGQVRLKVEKTAIHKDASELQQGAK